MLLLLSYPNETLKCIGGQIYDGVCAQMFLGEIKDSQAIYVELDVPVFGTANVCLNIWKNALFLLFWFTVWYTEYHCCSVGYWIHHWIFLRNGLLANLMDPLSLVNPHIKTWRIIFSAFSLIFCDIDILGDAQWERRILTSIWSLNLRLYSSIYSSQLIFDVISVEMKINVNKYIKST